MKKKSTKLIIALIVLALAIVAYVIVQKAGLNDEEETTEYLITLDSSNIYKYSYTLDDKTYAFTHDDDEGWKYDKDTDFAVDEDNMSVLLEYLWSTSVTRTLDDVEESSLADYGLDDPTIAITYQMKDGTTETFHVGDTNATTGDVYMYKDDDTSKVYLVSSDINSSYKTDLEDLRDEDAETESTEE